MRTLCRRYPGSASRPTGSDTVARSSRRAASASVAEGSSRRVTLDGARASVTPIPWIGTVRRPMRMAVRTPSSQARIAATAQMAARRPSTPATTAPRAHSTAPRTDRAGDDARERLAGLEARVDALGQLADADKMRPVHPGEILREDYLVPLRMSANALASNSSRRTISPSSGGGSPGPSRRSAPSWRPRPDDAALAWLQPETTVRKEGLEPSHPCGYRNLNPARLPIPPLSRVVAGVG